jgi:leucyl aminopeptidase (aminopeptidase T)
MWDWKEERYKEAVLKLFKENLCVQRGEKVCLLCDEEKERIGEVVFYHAVEEFPQIVHITYETTKMHGAEPPKSVWKAVFGEDFVIEMDSQSLWDKLYAKEVDEEVIKEILMETTSPTELPSVVIAINKFSLSHTLFRKLCTEFLAMRFASMPLFEPFMFFSSMQADWNKVSRLSVIVANYLTEAESAFITCPYGTEIVLNLEGRTGIADTGKICSPGNFGNLPAGEGFIAPVEGESEGVFVTKYAPDRVLKEPVKVFVENGSVSKLEGEPEFCKFLESVFEKDEKAKNIAELGIGTNERAECKTNILEAEKILGTCHIALGDNSSFGGKVRANFHLDLLVEKPTLKLTIKGKEVCLLKDGEVQFG